MRSAAVASYDFQVESATYDDKDFSPVVRADDVWRVGFSDPGYIKPFSPFGQVRRRIAIERKLYVLDAATTWVVLTSADVRAAGVFVYAYGGTTSGDARPEDVRLIDFLEQYFVTMTGGLGNTRVQSPIRRLLLEHDPASYKPTLPLPASERTTPPPPLYSRTASAPFWLAALEVGASGVVSDEQLSSLMDGIWESVEREQFHYLGYCLDSANFDRMPSIAIAGTLRFSFSVRDKLVGWSELVRTARSILAQRGEDVEDALSGLDEP